MRFASSVLQILHCSLDKFTIIIIVIISFIMVSYQTKMLVTSLVVIYSITIGFAFQGKIILFSNLKFK